MPRYASDVAFTPAVKAVQAELGSRNAYARVEAGAGWETRVTPALAGLLAELDMFYFATATAEGQPYVQYRGGPRGLLRPLDERRLAFADFGGNRQYLSVGNLSENPRAFVFLIDYQHRRRVKIWGQAEVSHDAELIARLADPAYPAPVERAIVLTVDAWDVNCPQHIHRRLPAEPVEEEIARLTARVRELEGELAERR